MGALYYIISDETPQCRHEFNDGESLRLYLIQAAPCRGEIYLANLEGFKISFDVQTGNVALNFIEYNPSITHFFTAEAFYLQLEPVVRAIRCLAKIELLQYLQDLNDQPISSILKENNLIDVKTGKIYLNVREDQLDDVISQIYHLVTPEGRKTKSLLNWLFDGKKQCATYSEIHEMLYSAFQKFESGPKKLLQHIDCRNDVSDLLDIMLLNDKLRKRV